MIKKQCSKHHWYMPAYSYPEWEPDDMKMRIFIVWKCVTCRLEKKEIFMDATDLTEAQIKTVLDTCISQGFEYLDVPF